MSPVFKNTIAVLLVAFLAISAPLAVPFIFAKDLPGIPGLSGIRPFSAEANFMSLEGFVISYYRVNHGIDISRGEARKIIKSHGAAGNQAYAAVRGEGRATLAPAGPLTAGEKTATMEALREIAHARDAKKISSMRPEPPSGLAGQVAAAPGAIVREEAPLEVKTGKVAAARISFDPDRVVILPFSNRSGNGQASWVVEDRVRRAFADRNFRVTDPRIAARALRDATTVTYYSQSTPLGVRKMPVIKKHVRLEAEKLTESQLTETAAYFGARYVVTGKVTRFDRARGAECRGRVNLDARVFDSKAGRFVYDERIRYIDRYHIPEARHRSDGIMKKAVNAAVLELFQNFFGN